MGTHTPAGTHTGHRVLILDDDLPEQAPFVVLVHGVGLARPPTGRPKSAWARVKEAQLGSHIPSRSTQPSALAVLLQEPQTPPLATQPMKLAPKCPQQTKRTAQPLHSSLGDASRKTQRSTLSRWEAGRGTLSLRVSDPHAGPCSGALSAARGPGYRGRP